MRLDLSRREALLGLVGASATASLGVHELVGDRNGGPGYRSVSRRQMTGLLTVADVVHPAEPEGFEPVLARYVARLPDHRRRALLGTLSELDAVSRRQFGTGFGSLSAPEARLLLEELGVDRVRSSPRGTLVERIRFHLVNSVLYALLTDPAGTAVLGIDNPVGHPGGFSSYTRRRTEGADDG